jgi:hypothetical protein
LQLRGLINLQPTGKGIAKLIPQIDDLVGRHWIGTRLSRALNASSIKSKSILLSSRFCITVLLTKPHALAEPYRDQSLRNSSGNLAIFAAILRASSLLSNLAADRRPGSLS